VRRGAWTWGSTTCCGPRRPNVPRRTRHLNPVRRRRRRRRAREPAHACGSGGCPPDKRSASGPYAPDKHSASGPYAPPVPARELTAVSADGARLHVEVHGPDGAPAVVLSHGWSCSTAFWAAQVRDLAADHRVIAYDQRGHGRSPANPVCSTDALADDLEAVLAATLAPGEKAVLVGHSMGGMTLMAAAGRARFREHAGAVLLCSTGSSRLVAESLVVPMRAGRARTWLTGKILGSRAPLGPVTPLARWILKYATMGPGSAPGMVDACARIVHACPRKVRYAWSHVLDTLDLDHRVRELTCRPRSSPERPTG
jgi:pimeloyl-ACP methyl ester carboxylesterase